ncbi:MAG: cytochrome c biogenesis CcdA family protein [Anaerolineae bacterium]
MNTVLLTWAFSAGMLATVNPCGWALLPAYASYYLGAKETDYDARPVTHRALEGVRLGLLMTAGFVLVFSVVGFAISAGLQALVQVLPLGALVVGLGLVLFGGWLLAGNALPFALPVPEFTLQARNAKSVFLYGVAYGVASLSCTLPVFLAVVAGSLTLRGPVDALAMFGGYSAGMAVVLMAVVVSIALAKDALLEYVQRALPFVHKIGAVLLIAAGLYLIWFVGRFMPVILSGFQS